MSLKVRKALIPAAGLGTRFLSATKVVPKELLPIVDRPALEYIIEELVESGIEEVILVIHPEKQNIANHFARGGMIEDALKARNQTDRLARLHHLIDSVTFTFTYQAEPLGLGHAVYCGRSAVGNEPFCVVLPDDLVRARVPCMKQLISVYEKEGKSVIAVREVPRDRTKYYGIVSADKPSAEIAFRVNDIVEKPPVDQAPSRWAVIGRYVLDPSVFEALAKVKPGAIGEIQLTDALVALAKKQGVMALPFEGTHVDIGQALGYVEANLLYAFDQPDMAEKLRPFISTLLEKK